MHFFSKYEKICCSVDLKNLCCSQTDPTIVLCKALKLWSRLLLRFCINSLFLPSFIVCLSKKNFSRLKQKERGGMKLNILNLKLKLPILEERADMSPEVVSSVLRRSFVQSSILPSVHDIEISY
jgi:hypothetical protein